MKIKLDENMPAGLAGVLSRLGHDVDTIPQEKLSGRKDPLVWEAAQKAGRFFITQDLDFSDARAFLPGTHHGLLLVRLREPGRKAITAYVKSFFETENIEDWPGCFMILTEHKFRIRRPK